MKSDAVYLLRFDDLCPTMKWEIWDEVEKILNQYQIKPIVAVIPDNQDSSQMCEDERPDFWEKVAEWQRQGWTIALHGYRHVYENKNGGIINVNDYSEFAGVEKSEQLARIRAGIEIFDKYGIQVDTWVAPAHSFDFNTVECLKQCGIHIISDGYSDNVFEWKGMKWIPCQLYRFVPKKSGVWTVCKHPSMWDREQLEAFREEMEQWHDTVTTMREISARTVSEEQSFRECRLSQKRCRRIGLKRKLIQLKKKVIKGVKKMKKILIKAYRLFKKDPIKAARKKNVTIGDNCRLNDMPRWGSEPYLVSLANHVEISLNVTFLTHDGATWCFRDEPTYKDVIKYGKISIRDNCFIGANVTILPGVTIGPNSIVGAGSVVTKNVEPDSVYAGVPARRICSLREYADKCLENTPDYDKEAYNRDKKKEVLRILNLLD